MQKKKSFPRQSLDSYHESQMPKLVGTLFRGSEAVAADMTPSRIFAVTSPQMSEGVSTIALLIAREVARNPERKTLLISTANLAKVTLDDLRQADQRWSREPVHGVWRMVPTGGRESATRPWETDPRFVRDVIAVLREHFGVVILDCGPLLSSSDLPRLGHLLDGTLVVIEAGRSTRPQIEHALEVLSMAGSELKGFVLNRRTYPIPERVYRWLRS